MAPPVLYSRAADGRFFEPDALLQSVAEATNPDTVAGVIDALRSAEDDEGDEGDEGAYIANLVFVACSEGSAAAVERFAAIREECWRHGFVALRIRDHPDVHVYPSRAMRTLIDQAHVGIFDVSEADESVTFALGMQTALDVEEDAVVVVRSTLAASSPRVLETLPFPVREFDGLQQLRRIVGHTMRTHRDRRGI